MFPIIKILSFLIFLLLPIVSITAQTIKMEKVGGVYKVPCKVNGLALKFIFDTGASDVSISSTEALFMLKNGYLKEDDLGGSEYYRIANGDIAEGTKVVLRKIEIGSKVLYNVEASIVHSIDAPLLLGQSVMERLGQFTIDYATNSLIIGKQGVSIKTNAINSPSAETAEAIKIAKQNADKIEAEEKAKVDAENIRLELEAKEARRKAKEDSLTVIRIAKENAERKEKEARLEALANAESQNKINYSTQSIYNNVWMSENLNEKRFRNGDLISNAQTDYEWKRAGENRQPAWCYYENDPKNEKKYGILYNGYAITDSRGLCPVGWHLPSREEWSTLINSLGGENYSGNKLKSKYDWPNKGNGTNSSGFNGLPAGIRDNDGAFYRIGKYGYWWGASYNYVYLSYLNDRAEIGQYISEPAKGMSIRCVKNSY